MLDEPGVLELEVVPELAELLPVAELPLVEVLRSELELGVVELG